jgi:hypothetical protein
MFANGRNMTQAKIETEYEILLKLIYDIPEFIQEEINQLECQITKESVINATGDQFVESNMRLIDDRNFLIDIQNGMRIYHNNAMIVMIRAFVETNLKVIRQNLIGKRTRNQKIDIIRRLYNDIKQEVNTLPIFEELWPNFDQLNTIRNNIIHDDIEDTQNGDITFLLEQLKNAKLVLLNVEKECTTYMEKHK